MSLEFVYDSFKDRVIYFYLVEVILSFIAFGLMSLFKKSITFTSGLYDFITNIKIFDPFEFILVFEGGI